MFKHVGVPKLRNSFLNTAQQGFGGMKNNLDSHSLMNRTGAEALHPAGPAGVLPQVGPGVFSPTKINIMPKLGTGEANSGQGGGGFRSIKRKLPGAQVGSMVQR